MPEQLRIILEHPVLPLTLALGLLCILIWNVYLTMRLTRLTKGGDGKSIEGTLHGMQATITELRTFRTEMEKYLTNVEKRLRRSVQFVSLKRFNPFEGSSEGGNQSFTSAFVSENGDGVVLSTIHARERMHIYGKAVEHFASGHELTEEEKSILESGKRALLAKEYEQSKANNTI